MSTQSSYPDPQAPDRQGASGLYVQGRESQAEATAENRKYDENNTLEVADMNMEDTHGLEQLSGHNDFNMQQQMIAQNAMELENHPAHGYIPPPHDGSTRERKRSKVSRACDECRRKKIRCDATGENGPESCTSCKRSGNSCQFSRQPLKRGPSKGYIKNLADRVKFIERNMSGSSNGLPPSSPQPQHQQLHQQTYSPPVPPTQPTTEDTFSTFHNPFTSSARHMLASASAVDQELMNRQHDLSESEQNLIYQTYGGQIQGVIQFLPEEPLELQIRLSITALALRQAFFSALECLLNTFTQANPQPESDPVEPLRHTLRLLDAAQYECDDSNAAFALSNHMVYLICLIMMTIVADQRTSPHNYMPGQAELIGRAAGRINTLRLDDDVKLAEGGNRLLTLGHRVHGALFILDRYHSFTFSSNPLLPLNSQLLVNAYDSIIGIREASLLVRVAETVGLYAHITKNAPPAALNLEVQDPVSHLFAHQSIGIILGSPFNMCRFAVDMLQLPENSVLHIALHHAELAAARLSPVPAPTQLLHLTNRLLSPLLEPGTPVTPLHVHFTNLAVTSLSDLVKQPQIQAEALKATEGFITALTQRAIVPILPDGQGWDQRLFKRLQAVKASTVEQQNGENDISGLQHLAEAAVTESHRPGSGGNEVGGEEAARAQASAQASTQATAAVAAAASQQSSSGESYDATTKAMLEQGVMGHDGLGF